jgi:hypothetical protein
MSGFLGRLGLSLLPLGLTPVLGFLLAEGYVNLGAGCKDIVALIPWLVWALAYFICSMVLWWKGAPVLMGTLYAAAGATGILILLFVILFLFQANFLGLKGL